MDRARRVLVVGLLLASCAALPYAQAPPAAPAPVALAPQAPVTLTPQAPVLTPEEMEVFLKNAKIIKRRDSGKGVTNTIRATFTDGRVTHDAQIQTVNITMPVFQAGRKTELNFKDTYRFNIGGYRLARLLDLNNVPMSVYRRVDGKEAAVTWWIDDRQFDEGGRLKEKSILGPNPERTTKQMHVLQVWDELIQNVDRNQGNYLWTTDWTLWMIDHTRAFRLGKDLLKPDQLTRCERSLFEAMRKLTMEDFKKAMSDILQKDEMEAVLARRDRIIKHFEERIATRGEANVLFTM